VRLDLEGEVGGEGDDWKAVGDEGGDEEGRRIDSRGSGRRRGRGESLLSSL
jgi:hypothetical protein